MPLIINALGGRHTDTDTQTQIHTHTHTHTHARIPTHEPKQFQETRHAWPLAAPGLKAICMCYYAFLSDESLFM